MSKQTKQYPAEFRQEAIRLALSDKTRSIAQIARDLGMPDATLYAWLSQAKVDSGEHPGLTTEEKEELWRLRREVKTLRMEREILKKAAAFFATESEVR